VAYGQTNRQQHCLYGSPREGELSKAGVTWIYRWIKKCSTVGIHFLPGTWKCTRVDC